MKSYNHFTPNERECLYLLLKNNYSRTQIAKELGRDKSTISREIRRNSDGNGNYTPFDAHMLYLIRRNECKRKSRIKRSSRLYKYIKDKLRKFWSPEVISESWNKSNPDDRISFSTIYNAVKNGLFDGITVQTHLRRRGKKKYGKRSRFCTIQPEHTIHERPKKAEKRSECGHFEGDTVRGAVGKGCIVTFVDRKSRKLLSAVSKDMSSKSVYDAILRAFKGIHPKSITLDNGSEFALFKQLEKALDTTVYFADPHSPWQRGSNENINDCLRFFFPKGFDFRTLSDEQLNKVVDIINSRPRLCLNLFSPNRIFRCT